MSALTSTLEKHALPDGSIQFRITINSPTRGGIACLLEHEEQVMVRLNEIGSELMSEAIATFDTEGEPIEIGGRNLTTKGRQTETFQTSFGPTTVARHIYQYATGGKTFVPVDHRCRLVLLTTPRWAKIVSEKYVEASGLKVQQDLASAHLREHSLTYIQSIVAEVARIAQRKENHWTYIPLAEQKKVTSIGLGVDGTCAPILLESSWKQVMVGTITLYDEEGGVLEIFRYANSPEDGKISFWARMEREITQFKSHYPDALWVGVSDGASDLRPFLEKHCTQLVLDFYHAAEYLAAIAPLLATKELPHTPETIAKLLHQLKHDAGAATQLLERMEERVGNQTGGQKLGACQLESLEKTINYFSNNVDRMDYAEALAEHLPIGSGITEAACKTLVKARFCASGMRWHGKGMQDLLTLRSLRMSSNRWGQFWARLCREGY